MARIIGGIACSHTPTIGVAVVLIVNWLEP